MGYMSSDPELKTFNSGKTKCSFSMGMNSGKETTWVDIECWDKIANNCSKILKKGSLVFIEGKLKYLSWKDKNGFSRSKLICVCDFFKSIKSKNPNEGVQSSSKQHNVSEIMKDDAELQKELEDIPW